MTIALAGREVVLGVCGGIAAYKSAELVRLLKGAGAAVRVVMSRNAGWFVGAGTFEALSGRPVFREMFADGGDGAIRHIEWARAAQAVVVAPATANFLAKLAAGVADDALTTFMLATTAPVLICPAMNSDMFAHPAVQRNLQTLRRDGCAILDPECGELACGTSGPGRLPPPERILDRLAALLTPKDLAGRRVLVTAGPTQEPIDPVRFISNPSSGKMGYALAAAAEHRGASVVLVTGPTALPDPAAVALIRTRTAAEMTAAVLQQLDGAEVVIKAAAVSDYRPRSIAAHKIKKRETGLILELERTADILQTVGRRKQGRFLVGFAAETENLADNARGKLAAKHLDMIVANLVGRPDSGFGSENNTAMLFYRDGTSEELPGMSKTALAHCILDRIVARLAPAP
jgi:phosphopantothenoylcysteine decarboxylase/phosphopantothenate--cysteine ligase